MCGKACPHSVQGKAADIKVKGNAAFKAKLYGEAVKHFSECIKLDSRCRLQHVRGAVTAASCRDACTFGKVL